MKTFFSTVASTGALLIALAAFLLPQQTTQDSPANQNPQETPAATFDAELAKSVGADDYGMKSYVLVTLITGKVDVKDEKKKADIFKGHFANMARMAKEEKLVVAGPLDGAPKRGIFILNVTTIEEAEALVKTDPAVEAGVFDYELTKLYCSAALMKINEIHSKIQKVKM